MAGTRDITPERGPAFLSNEESKDDAPAFFGHDTRYGHRIYGGIILNVLR